MNANELLTISYRRPTVLLALILAHSVGSAIGIPFDRGAGGANPMPRGASPIHHLPQPPAPQDSDPWVARIGDFEIRQSQLDARLRRIDLARLSDTQRRRLWAATLDQLVREAIVLVFLRDGGWMMNEDELRLETEELAAEAKAIGKTLDQWLRERNQTEWGWRQQLVWQASWQRYLDAQLSESRLEEFFLSNPRRYDGTRWQVSQLLVAVPSDAEPAKWDDAEQRVHVVRDQLLAGTRSWDQAIAEWSKGREGASAGELGWVTCDGTMPPAVEEALPSLEVGQVSPVFRSRLGVHLLWCRSLEPGKRGWRDARERVRTDLIHHLFDDIVARQRPQVKTEFSSQAADFHPKEPDDQ